MSAHTADSQFAFRLPSLSYIDASWEEPELRNPVAAPAPNVGWLASRVAGFRTWRRNQRAAYELATMTDHELMDIGVSRSDLSRVFDTELNEDLRNRGSSV